MKEPLWELLDFCVRGTEVTIQSGREELMASVTPGTRAVLQRAGEDGSLIGILEDGRPCILIWGKDRMERCDRTVPGSEPSQPEWVRPKKEVTIYLVLHEAKEA